MIDEMTKPHDGVRKGMTVEQLANILDRMPQDMVVVVEGDRLIDPHVVMDVLPPEDDEGYSDSAACNTVLLTVGGKWQPTEQEVTNAV